MWRKGTKKSSYKEVHPEPVSEEEINVLTLPSMAPRLERAGNEGWTEVTDKEPFPEGRAFEKDSEITDVNEVTTDVPVVTKAPDVSENSGKTKIKEDNETTPEDELNEVTEDPGVAEVHEVTKDGFELTGIKEIFDVLKTWSATFIN